MTDELTADPKILFQKNSLVKLQFKNVVNVFKDQMFQFLGSKLFLNRPNKNLRFSIQLNNYEVYEVSTSAKTFF